MAKSRICECCKREFLELDMRGKLCVCCYDFIEEYQDKQIAVLEKALELACERVKYFEEMQDREMGHFELFGYDTDYDLQAIIEQYKEIAKEELKSE